METREKQPAVIPHGAKGGEDLSWLPDEEFRNSLATINERGKRIWLFPKRVTGLWMSRRRWVAYFLFSLWVLGPWLEWNGQQLFVFNIIERHFVIYGQHFYPQDLVYFGILLLTFFLFIALFTMTYGRVWCGWACPQTVFMEHIFRPIEQWIEGSPAQQRALKSSPWTAEKIGKRLAKHSIYLVFSAGIGLLVLFYLGGRVQVFEWLAAGPMTNKTFLSIGLGFATLFFLVFSWAREQVCIAMCPYGRLQGVLLNNKSLTVMYNWLRGEPRRPIKREKDSAVAQVVGPAIMEPTQAAGDCVDCGLCVQVCPTGIDIRNGTQLECVNCTACIDVCDFVMDKVGKPQGLISLSSNYAVEHNEGKWGTSVRMWIATTIMVLLLAADVVILATRQPLSITLLRVPGTLYQQQYPGYVTNLYNVQFVNKTNKLMALKANIPGAKIKLIKGDFNIPANGYRDLTLFIEVPAKELKHGKNQLEASFTSADGSVYTKTTSFLAP